MTDTPPPGRTATIGLHGSASTWVFNITRELLIAAVGEDQVVALYAEDVDALPDAAALGARHLVLKSHHGSAGLDAWLESVKARIVISLRDPRDAALSMTQRFGAPLAHTVQWLAQDCSRMMRLVGRAHALLRYEDRFFEDCAAPGRLARVLGLQPEPAVAMALFERYRTDAMRRFTQTLTELPPDRVMKTEHTVMDRVTQIHRTHIGDARIGKWRDLPPATQAAMTKLFGPFLERFGYPR